MKAGGDEGQVVIGWIMGSLETLYLRNLEEKRSCIDINLENDALRTIVVVYDSDITIV